MTNAEGGNSLATTMSNINNTLQAIDLRKPILSTLAQKGNDQLVEQFLMENVKLGTAESETIQSQLYIASFWGFHDVVKTLVANGADINAQNVNTKWTPLHAAAFQEHGKVIMLLLENGANPEIKDFEGRTPKDFASASDKIWPLFAACKCSRTPKQELIEKGVLQKSTGGFSQAQDLPPGRRSTAASLLKFSDEETAFGGENNNAYAAAVNGDVLAGGQERTRVISPKQQAKSTDKPSFLAWRS